MTSATATTTGGDTGNPEYSAQLDALGGKGEGEEGDVNKGGDGSVNDIHEDDARVEGQHGERGAP